MEKLNLYAGRKDKKIKMKTFIFLIIISLVPSVSIFFGSSTWKMINVEKILSKHPMVFKDIRSTGTSSIINELEVLNNSLKQKNTVTEQKVYQLESTICSAFKSTEYLKVLAKTFANIDNKVFLSQITANESTFFIEFYEFGSLTKFSTTTTYEELSKIYKNVSVNLSESKQLFNNLYYYKYTLGGEM